MDWLKLSFFSSFVCSSFYFPPFVFFSFFVENHVLRLQSKGFVFDEGVGNSVGETNCLSSFQQCFNERFDDKI